MLPDKGDFYRRLRQRVRTWSTGAEGRGHRWTEFVLLAPDLFHLLCKLAADPRVPRTEKAKLASALAYFISPLDLLPEALFGPVGFLDDVALAAYVLNGLLNRTDPEVLRRHWAGERDVLDWVQRIPGVADRLVGGGLWQKLRRLVG